MTDQRFAELQTELSVLTSDQLSVCLAENGMGARDRHKDARIAEISAEIKRLR
jgi:hypothetical protein